MQRWLLLYSSLGLTAILTGCQAPESTVVPWWRGIPARLTTASSLEAEAWRRQHGYPGESPPIPSRVIIGPLGEPGESIPAPGPLLDEPQANESAPGEEKWDPTVPPTPRDAEG